MKILAEGLLFPEGPVAMDDGSVVLVDRRAGRTSRVLAEDPFTRGGLFAASQVVRWRKTFFDKQRVR